MFKGNRDLGITSGGMEIDLEGIVIIVGNYGSGKTEIAINLAANRKRAGIDVRIADLDLINPYFRTREAKRELAEIGVEVVMPPAKYFHADLPILSPNVAGMIMNPSRLTILDAGGNDAGAMVLAALGAVLRGKSIQMLQVVNPFRPFTETVEGCVKIKTEIERAAKLEVTGIVGNANMMDDTTVDHIYGGYDFVSDLARTIGIDLKFVTAPANLFPRLNLERFERPVLPIERRLTPPWRPAASKPSKV